MKIRSGLSEAWLVAHGQTVLDLFIQDRLADADQMIERVFDEGVLAAPPYQVMLQVANGVHALVDLAGTVAAEAASVMPKGSIYAFETVSLDDGEPLTPETFTGTPEGWALIWAGRIITFAANGDQEMVELWLDQLDATDTPLGRVKYSIGCLVRAASHLVVEHRHRLMIEDIGRTFDTGRPPRYVAACTDRDSRPGRVPLLVCPTRRMAFNDAYERDLFASEHTFRTGHAVTRTTEWGAT